jgi:hypothetical protein
MREYKPADQIIAEAIGVGPKYVEQDIEAYFQRYQQTPDDKTPALMAFSELATAVANLESGDQNSHEGILVPRWIMQALGPGLEAYLEARGDLSLEKALGVRRTRSQIDDRETQMREMKIALEVFHLLGPNPETGDVVKAISLVSQKRNASTEAIWKAWGQYKDFVKERWAAMSSDKDGSH